VFDGWDLGLISRLQEIRNKVKPSNEKKSIVVDILLVCLWAEAAWWFYSFLTRASSAQKQASNHQQPDVWRQYEG